MIPIYKKGKVNDPKNYRPISLTSVICRILERIIHYYILTHSLNNQIISYAQHGFITRRSTQTQQILFFDQITSMFEDKAQVEIVYLDFSKAFDKVSHPKLLHVLTHYKVDYKVTNWIRNYLADRTQSTSVESCISDSICVKSGVPQGSVLGPLLFVLFIDGLIKNICFHCKNTTVFAFADDIKLLSTEPRDIQRALDIVDSWTKNWGLQLNADKSEHLTLRNNDPIPLYIGGKEIPSVNEVRDLGVIVSSDLQWSNYTRKIRAKANIISHLLLKTFTSNNPHLLINLYKTYVRPIVEYNTCTWSSGSRPVTKEVESVQKTYTRKVCQRGNVSFSSYEERLRILDLESLEVRRKKRDLIFVYKIIYGLVDIEATTLFQFSTFGGHNLRRHKLHIYRLKAANTPCRRSFFSNRVIEEWNKLPESTVLSPSIDVFKSRLNAT